MAADKGVRVEVTVGLGGTTTTVVAKVVAEDCTDVPIQGATTTTGRFSLSGATAVATLVRAGLEVVKLARALWHS